MRYFIRALKYLVYFTAFFCVMVGIIWILSPEKTQGLPVTALFREGSLKSIVILIVVVAAIYPYLSFVKRRIRIEEEFSACRSRIVEVFESVGMEVESESDNRICFRMTSRGKRFSHMWEDRITLTVFGGTLEFEGYRRDLDRIVRAIKYNLTTTTVSK